jgi:hypothetical protein
MCISAVTGNNWEGMTSIHKSRQTGTAAECDNRNQALLVPSKVLVHRLRGEDSHEGKRQFLDCLAVEDWTDRLSRNVRN